MRRGTSALTAILISLVLSPISAIVGAWTMSKMWEWFLSRDYGAGPSLAGWFGVASIFGVLMAPQILHLAREEPDKETGPIAKVVTVAIGTWVGLLISLGFAWVAGFALHWV